MIDRLNFKVFFKSVVELLREEKTKKENKMSKKSFNEHGVQFQFHANKKQIEEFIKEFPHSCDEIVRRYAEITKYTTSGKLKIKNMTPLNLGLYHRLKKYCEMNATVNERPKEDDVFFI